ncbi:hypothetical protein ACHAO7_011285 [Fusarium culmorum]
MPSVIPTSLAGKLSFAGKTGDCKPKVYVAYVKKKIRRENTDLDEDDEEDRELLDAFLTQAFQRGLTGPALYWFEEERLCEKPFSEIVLRFTEKYENSSTLNDSALISEAYHLDRRSGEALQDFIQRSQNLYHRIPPTYRSVLLINFILRLADGERDERLQERIQDRLFAADLLRDDAATDGLTFDKPGAEEHSPNAVATESDRLWEAGLAVQKLAETHIKLTETLIENQKAGNNPSANNQNANRWNGNTYRQPAGVQSSTYQTGTGGPNDPTDKDYWWCFNCAEYGHKSGDCKLPPDRARRSNNAAYYNANRDKLMATRGEQLRKNRAAPVNTIGSFAQAPKPPRGYILTPTSQSTQQTFRASSDGGRAPMGPAISETQPLEIMRPGDVTLSIMYPETQALSIVRPTGVVTPECRELATWRPLESNAATRSNEKTQPKAQPKTGNTPSENEERLRALADAALSHPEWVEAAPSRNKTTKLPEPHIVEVVDDEGDLPVQTEPVDAVKITGITEEEFRKLLTKLDPEWVERAMRERKSAHGKPDTEKERKPRHVLEPIRATEQYSIPDFEIGQHLKDTTVTLSVLELLQVAPSIRQQLSRLMQCRRKLKGSRHEEKLVNFLAPFRQMMEAEMSEELGDPDNKMGIKCVASIRLLGDQPLSTETYECNLIGKRQTGHQAVQQDSGLPEEAVATTLGYINGKLDGFQASAILLDGGSGVNLVNRRFLLDSNLHPIDMRAEEPLRLANDEMAYVSQFAILELVVGNVLTVITVYVIDGACDWDLLVGRPWLRRVQGVEHYADEKLLVRGLSGKKTLIDITPCPKRYHPVEPKDVSRPACKQGWSEKLEGENVVHVENDDEILQEVEEILSGLHATVRVAQERVHSSGN